MKLMHTKLPEFIIKMKTAAAEARISKELKIKGLENLEYAKMQSLRTGRIEHAVKEMAEKDGIDSVEMAVIPRVPETMHTVIIKGIDKNGKVKSGILELVNIIHATEEAELEDCQEVDDRRPGIGKH